MTIEKPTYVKAGALLMLLYATILTRAQYSYYYKSLFCPIDSVIVEKSDCIEYIKTQDAATNIQLACIQKLNEEPKKSSKNTFTYNILRGLRVL